MKDTANAPTVGKGGKIRHSTSSGNSDQINLETSGYKGLAQKNENGSGYVVVGE